MQTTELLIPTGFPDAAGVRSWVGEPESGAAEFNIVVCSPEPLPATRSGAFPVGNLECLPQPGRVLSGGTSNPGKGDRTGRRRPVQRLHATPKPRLGPRETEVLTQVAAGYRYKEIGARLGLSIETVRTHLKRVYRKLGVHSALHAVARLREINALSPLLPDPPLECPNTENPPVLRAPQPLAITAADANDQPILADRAHVARHPTG
jgi:DNA-binding CsgD family transcriptional regulator